jgi:preprotein translocase subunit SecE
LTQTSNHGILAVSQKALSGLFLRGKNTKDMEKIIRFLQEAKVELSRVNWPSQKQVIQYTVVVVVLSFLVAILLGSLDLLFSKLVEKYFLNV